MRHMLASHKEGASLTWAGLDPRNEWQARAPITLVPSTRAIRRCGRVVAVVARRSSVENMLLWLGMSVTYVGRWQMERWRLQRACGGVAERMVRAMMRRSSQESGHLDNCVEQQDAGALSVYAPWPLERFADVTHSWWASSSWTRPHTKPKPSALPTLFLVSFCVCFFFCFFPDKHLRL